MTDSKLRELERRWKESGSVEDEAAHLLERVRVGELEWEKLELAAFCGHEGARRALGRETPPSPPDVPRWAMGLARWGKACCARASRAAVEPLIAAWQPSGNLPFEPATAREALAAVEAWIENPSPQLEATASDLANRLAWPGMDEVVRAAQWAAEVIGSGSEIAAGTNLERRIELVLVHAARAEGSETPSRERASEALVEWALR